MTSRSLTWWHVALILMLVGASAVLRLAPHVPNVAPMAAVSLLAGATLPGGWALLVPAAAMFAADAVIGFYQWQIMAAVYGSLLLTVGLGRWLKQNRWPWRIIGASLGASVLFYLVTNLAVWRYSGMYPLTLDGLSSSYYLALPFFRNTLLGDMMYVYATFLTAEYAPVLALRLQQWRQARMAAAEVLASSRIEVK